MPVNYTDKEKSLAPVLWIWHKKALVQIWNKKVGFYYFCPPQSGRPTSHCKLPHFTPQIGSRNMQSTLALGHLWLPSGFIALTLEPDSSCVEAGRHNRDAFCLWSTALNIAQGAPSQEPDWRIQTERIKIPNHGKPSWAPTHSVQREGEKKNLWTSLVDLWLP